MPKGLTFLPSLALAVVMALPLAAETKPTADTVVASVNGEDITLGHMILARAALPQQYQQLPDEVLYQAILDQLIQQNLLKQSRGTDVPKHVELALENEQRSLLAADVLEDIASGAMSDDAVQAAYDAQYSDWTGGDEFQASHILVETEEEAKAIKADLDNGADFAAMAKEKSTGPSGPNGGSLGWFGMGAMVPEFEAAVVDLSPGEVSAPVKTQFGWHVVLLSDKRKAEAPTLDEVRGELATKIQQDAVDAKVAELTKAGEIERPEVEGLEPSVLRDVELVQE
ncbi:peptidylprolyl isomerase [Falsiruegeria mediterranea]|jgi:peptidyl-prolyl cis-trans isomerase C|uniref:Parvulin-like PPIase n=1 Tax=Falsiruegeria mediterranea M17 TaxID=1200281 RepID=A0A2R8C3R8_9RHOB|nr:peptidylprolyl isomerase [Falsiruegeria mediterranea]SPJ27074.1 putative parvulin-type peptidyl-prolyl cis-trans isomerase [Falsiruegeria mediterranea M17]